MLTGNREFNEIYEQYKNLVLKVAYMYSGNNYDAAEDITQDAFLKLYMHFDDLKEGNIKAWLSVTARNEAINFCKKHKKEILELDAEESTVEEPVRESLEEEYGKISLQREQQELHRKIFEELYEKNRRWYDALMLSYYMELPQEKVAKIMNVRTGTVHSILHRARKWIRKTYGVEYEEMKRKD